MEHIVQFAISMDDAAIKNAVEKNAEKEIIAGIRKDIEAALFKTSYYGSVDKNELSYWAQNLVENMLAENKDAIIERAGELLSARLVKTKAVKEMLADITSQ